MWTPIIVRKKNRTIIAGNNRYKALQKLGAVKVPVIFKDLSEADADVLMVTHNKLTQNTPWDFPKLADLFVEFDQLDVDMDLTGFDTGEVERIVAHVPSDKDWADAFDDNADAEWTGGFKHMTVVLPTGDMARLVEHLKTYDPNKNQAILKWLEASL